MTDEIESDLNGVDSDKSFESCIDPDCQKIDELDDSSVKSFHSCANTKTNSKIDGDKNEPVEPQEDEDDDDIRPGSCRDHPSSDEDAGSCWSDENGDWIYDAEFVAAKRSHETEVAPEVAPEVVPVVNEQKPEKSPPEKSRQRNRPVYARRNNHNNPTYIPTSGRFFMHDLRQNDEESQSRGNYHNNGGYRRPRNNYRGGGGGGGAARGKENRLDGGSSDRWVHDLYVEAEQRPLSHSQLADKYGDNRSSSSRHPRAKKHQKSINNKRQQINNNTYDEYEYEYDCGYYYDYYNNDYYGNYRRGADADDRYSHSYSARRPNRYHHPGSRGSQHCGPTRYSDIRITVDVANRGGGGARSIRAVSNGNEHGGSSSKSRRPIKPAADPPISSTNRSASHKSRANRDPINTCGDCWEASAPGESVPDVIGEMPPLTEAEMSRLQWRQHQQHQQSSVSTKPIINKQPPPRFSRDKSSDNNQSRSITGNNHVPKRYSELRNHHRQATPDDGNQSINFASPPPPQQQQHASYQQHLSSLMMKAPLAVATTHVANSNAPQLVSLGPMFGGDAHALSQHQPHQQHQQQQQQYYVYLSPAAGPRLSQYSPAFTPSFPAGALYHHPPAQPPPQHPAPAAAPSPQSTPRPVLGKS